MNSVTEPAGGEAPPSSIGPVVSVIMIFRNPLSFFAEAIDSVIGQTFQEWELLLVDDGSTDGSSELAASYARCHTHRIRVLHHPLRANRGMSASRNLGIREASGEFVAFLDADDVWPPGQLEEQTRILCEHHSADAVLGRTRYWHSWSGQPTDLGRDWDTKLPLAADGVVRPPALFFSLWRGNGAYFCICSLMVRREVIERIGGFDDQFTGLCEDIVLYVKLLLDSPVYVSSQVWGRYRQHPKSACAVGTASGTRAKARERLLDWSDDYLRRRGITDGSLVHELERERRRLRHPVLARYSPLSRLSVMQDRNEARAILRRALPRHALLSLRWFRRRRERFGRPPVGRVRFGSLRRLKPISGRWGSDRGLPMDRHYIESFLATQASDIYGSVLEVGDATYTHRFGGSRVTSSDVLHVFEGNPNATIVADLADADHLPADTFDCVILTQVLQLIYDVEAAVTTLHRILKPGGVLLATLSGISRIDEDEWGRPHWFWNFTPLSGSRLFGDVFGREQIDVRSYGNVLTAVAFLHGIAVSELRLDELDSHDRHYPVIVAVRARKAMSHP